MGAMKAFTLWFPLERLSSLTGMMIAAGGLGGLAATTPIELGAGAFGWRAMFAILAVLCVACAAYIALVVPEKVLPGAGESWREAFRRMAKLFSIPLFWRVGLPLMTVQASFQALIGLWLAPWLIDVAGLPRAEAANWLFAAVLSYTLGSIAFGVGADQLAARGISRLSLLKWGTAIAIAALAGLAAAPAHGKFPLLLVYSFAMFAPALSYGVLTLHFAPELSGRVNTALNVAMFTFAFSVQWGVGAILRLFPAEGGRYAAEGYAIAFSALAAIHLVAWLWLVTLREEPQPYRQ
jgi:predicted MFS family arabinose efflux permease